MSPRHARDRCDPSMTRSDFAIRSRRVVTSLGVKPAAVHVHGGVIAKVGALDEVPAGSIVIDGGHAVLMPGLVDTHVHINGPGRTDWEGFATATRAAAAGGVTTLIDMPLNSVPPTTTAAGLCAKLEAARGKCFVDVGFWGGALPSNQAELSPLFDAGVFGFKCFLVPSGVDEFPNLVEVDLRTAMRELSRMRAPLLVHAELPGPIEHAASIENPAPGVSRVSGTPQASDDSRRYARYLRSRPAEAESEAVKLVIRLCREFRTRVHIVHVSSADAVSLLRDAQAEGLPITAETCPHYLHFAAEDIAEGATAHKCAPPIRERSQREALWKALGEGVLDMVVSDHSPCPSHMKALDSGDWMQAWGGISSLQLGLSVCWLGARERGFPIWWLAEWLSRAPARLAGLEGRKGAITVGYDADLVVWRPEMEYLVEPSALFHRNALTPYNGLRLPGVVEATWLRGMLVYSRGDFPSPPAGTILKRTAR